MLKKILIAAALGASVPANAAVVITFDDGGSTVGPNQTIVEDFEGTPAGTSLGTNASVYANSVDGIAARPAVGSTGNFGAVLGGGAYQLGFAATPIFSFALGSLDAYNILTLLLSDATTISYTGAQINQGLSANGSQVSNLTNGRVTYTATGGPQIVGVRFESTSNSFEFDNLAVAAVPEPATWMMMILGFMGVGYSLRRRPRNARNAAFA